MFSFKLLVSFLLLTAVLWALDPPVITAIVKGPTQVNLTWLPVSSPGYGYIVEVYSLSDARYTSFTEYRPIPNASGYICNSSCMISDPIGLHIYNLPVNGVPYWVTEANYIDPLDGSSAQFIVSGLLPNTPYAFRVRSYSGISSPSSSAYSNTATVTTANYAARYVSPSGSDSNDGTASDPAHAWQTLLRGSHSITCGQVLLVLAGSYANDQIVLQQNCTANNRVVVTAYGGAAVIITSPPAGQNQTISLSGAYEVIDGITSRANPSQGGEFSVLLDGANEALLGVEVGPPSVPGTGGGVSLLGSNDLIYGSYLHDMGIPDASLNPDGNGGWVLAGQGGARHNVIWSNHLTRGGHDESLAKGMSHSRWLNNIMDGGWGQCFDDQWYSAAQPSDHHLIEGSVCYHTGQLVRYYKPAIQISQGNTTVRRNVVIGAASNAIEESLLNGGSMANTLVYNNTFFTEQSCLFQSTLNGVSAGSYNDSVFVNNICYPLSNLGTDIYLKDMTNVYTTNDFLYAAAGKSKPTQPIIIWNHGAQESYQYPVSVATADSKYAPPFSNNAPFSADPRFVDSGNDDFHLAQNSPLLGQGTPVTDREWGSTPPLRLDIGAYGIPTAPVCLDLRRAADNAGCRPAIRGSTAVR